MKYQNIREEELKNRVAQDYFWKYDCQQIIGNVDFCVSMHKNTDLEQESILWAEAKTGISDIYNSLTQLILTIGKARTFDKHLPPSFLGAFDSEKIAFIPYNEINDIFYINDFNWNVAPSNYKTKEFKLIHKKISSLIDDKALLFDYEDDDRELKKFIEKNFVANKFGVTKTQIDKNNFIVIYNKWLKEVKPTIAVNWDKAKKSNIIDGDFYLADLLSENNVTIKDKLFVLLKKDNYVLDRRFDDLGLFSSRNATFTDNQVAHTQFWNRYERPPKDTYWDYIVKRRDLLVPQDIRERKGSFFTPQIWVELSQKYLADALGENWQDEYYVWDCAAGTGNLLTGLTNKYNIWASTLDKQDVEVMKDRIKNGANLLEEHVFQFDFLNDDFSKLPEPLQEIINDPKKRKKLVIYINPPYAETAKKQTSKKGRINKRGVSFTKIQEKYSDKIGIATKELFAQFLIKVNFEIPNCILAQFSTFKFIQGPNFRKFREHFKAKFYNGFIVQSNTFDNVKGRFPIGFMIWEMDNLNEIDTIRCNIYDAEGKVVGKKKFHSSSGYKFITDWLRPYHSRVVDNSVIGAIGLYGSDFQHNNFIRITNLVNHPNRWTFINCSNVKKVCIYFSIRNCIKSTWLNDRDQFLYPNNKWKKDSEFQNDCLAFTLFHGQNKVTALLSTNHWIPFTEYEVESKEKFDSNFMTKFIQGKLQPEEDSKMFDKVNFHTEHLEFSEEAEAVFSAGRELWKYYHSTASQDREKYNPNASLYDIREYFQGRNEKGRMNSHSEDDNYTKLIEKLRKKLNFLAEKIESKVYEYGFLKK